MTRGAEQSCVGGRINIFFWNPNGWTWARWWRMKDKFDVCMKTKYSSLTTGVMIWCAICYGSNLPLISIPCILLAHRFYNWFWYDSFKLFLMSYSNTIRQDHVRYCCQKIFGKSRSLYFTLACPIKCAWEIMGQTLRSSINR